MCLVVAFACNKQYGLNIQNSKNAASIRWLQKNGGNYKNQMMVMRLLDSSLIKGKLDWNKRTDYTVGGINYWEVPFVFEKMGENIPIESGGGYTRFRLVMREVNGRYDGAIQTTEINNTLVNVENEGKLQTNIQTYSTLTGDPLNAYMRNVGEIKPKAISISPAQPGVTRFRGLSTGSTNQTGGN